MSDLLSSRGARRLRVAGAFALLCGGAATLSSASPPAPMHSTGISGYSSKQGVICTFCHSGGTAPTVKLVGPMYVLHDSTVRYTFTVSGGQKVAAGLDVAIDDNSGTLAATDTGTHLDNNEVTHDMPRNVDSNGDAAFFFDYTAPSTAMSLAMYAAGNSVNLNFADTGDNARAKSIKIAVVDNLTSFQKFGTGTAGSGGIVPTVQTVDGPSVGPWSITINNVLGGASGFLWVGFAMKDQNAFGGHFYVDLSSPFALAPLAFGGTPGTPGDGSVTLNGVDVSSYAPLTLFLQGTMIDAGAAKGVSMTKGIEMDVRN
jgi:hypothetical protein